jgi:L-seryl-tRNA(Ser) seleniumtransferase
MSEAPDELRKLPSVDALLNHARLETVLRQVPRVVVRRAVREVLDVERRALREHGDGAAQTATIDVLAARAADRAMQLTAIGVRSVVNVTGIVVHTNLGRSPLADAAIEAMNIAAQGYSTLEFDLERGERGSRLGAIRWLLTELTGAEDALVVNNCAGAVLLSLAVLASGREVIVSRGELVEIGGSFRIPEIMERSGARLVEVGTTNKTRGDDYERAIGPRTAMLLKAHRSNFSMEGFVEEVELGELVDIGRRHDVPVLHDLGSGAFIDLARLGVAREPTIFDSLRAQPHLTAFSGDKLLGGPQSGILLGERAYIRRLAKDPMARALRLDKLSIAALEATLKIYLEPDRAIEELPSLRMLARSQAELREAAEVLARALRGARPDLAFEVVETESRVGGGAQPSARIPSFAVAVDLGTGREVADFAAALRRHDPPVVGRIEADRLLLDVRTMMLGDSDRIVAAFATEDDSGVGR